MKIAMKMEKSHYKSRFRQVKEKKKKNKPHIRNQRPKKRYKVYFSGKNFDTFFQPHFSVSIFTTQGTFFMKLFYTKMCAIHNTTQLSRLLSEELLKNSKQYENCNENGKISLQITFSAG